MIHAEALSKTFKLYRSPADRLKEILTGRTYGRKFHALKGVSFTVQAGETLGIIGQNGAGKSTLLKILTGVLLPDAGTVHIAGKITGLLELGTGFNPDFTGLQNIHLNGALLGMSRGEIAAKLDRIVAFSELQDFIYQPLKTYSSGMVMRLAFAISIHADPKAFVVDEALSVGDAYFQQKCMARIRQFKEAGGAIVFVSHDLNSVKVLCDKALLLDEGAIVSEGDPDTVVDSYNFLLARKSEQCQKSLQEDFQQGMAYGNSKVEIVKVELLNDRGIETGVFASGEGCTIAVTLHAKEDIEDLTVGILIRDKYGQDIFGTNTYHMKTPLRLQNDENCRVRYRIDEFNLGPGKYTLTVAAHQQDTHVHECYQWIDKIQSFEVVSGGDFVFIGLSRLKPKVDLEKI